MVDVHSNGTKRFSRLKSVIFSVAVIVLFLVLIESGLRMIPTTRHTSDNTDSLPLWVVSNLDESKLIQDRLLFWRIPPSTKRLHTNSCGLIGPEFTLRKKLGIFRIITMGDSCTWGFGVNPGQEYPRQLRIILNQTKLPVIFEVQNAGVPGYSSLQGLRYLKSEILQYHPDVITLYFGRNDCRNLQEEGGYVPDHEVPILPTWLYPVKSVLNYSKTYQMLRAVIFNMQDGSDDQSPEQHLTKHTSRTHRVSGDEFKQNFQTMIDIAKSNNITPLAITSPTFPATVGNYNNLIRAICRDNDVWCLDAEVEFAVHGGNQWLVDECHPDINGHRWIANQLKIKILELYSIAY